MVGEHRDGLEKRMNWPCDRDQDWLSAHGAEQLRKTMSAQFSAELGRNVEIFLQFFSSLRRSFAFGAHIVTFGAHIALSFARALCHRALFFASVLLTSTGNPVQKCSSSTGSMTQLTKSDWSSIRAAYDAGRHAFQPVEGGRQARNPGQQWATKFDGRGFIAQPKGGADWQWGLELKSYGYAGNERAIGGADHMPAVKAEGQCLIPTDSRQKTDSRDLMKTRSAPKSAPGQSAITKVRARYL